MRRGFLSVILNLDEESQVFGQIGLEENGIKLIDLWTKDTAFPKLGFSVKSLLEASLGLVIDNLFRKQDLKLFISVPTLTHSKEAFKTWVFQGLPVEPETVASPVFFIR